MANREKDLQYASRAVNQIKQQRQIHRMRHIISSLVEKLPPEVQNSNEVKSLAAYGCKTRMHVVRLLAPRLKNEDHTKDVDFSPKGIDARWRAGLEDMRETLAAKPWDAEHDPDEGFVLHDAAKSIRTEMQEE